jgi:hypothetical protein
MSAVEVRSVQFEAGMRSLDWSGGASLAGSLTGNISRVSPCTRIYSKLAGNGSIIPFPFFAAPASR